MRRPPGTPRAAVVLWIVLAIVVWNVVFDRVLVVAGRQYVHAATIAARASEPYLRIDDWMRPARARAVRTATAAALVILAAGLTAVGFAVSRSPKGSRLKAQGSGENLQSEI
jgi:hypothetical protein